MDFFVGAKENIGTQEMLLCPIHFLSGLNRGDEGGVETLTILVVTLLWTLLPW